jgi:hypothetical protein
MRLLSQVYGNGRLPKSAIPCGNFTIYSFNVKKKENEKEGG